MENSPDTEKKKPFAEMWMGTHLSSSQTESNGAPVELTEIAGSLPFLFKLLAVEKPLSLQAHPNKKQAEEGFAREETEGLSLNAASRNYKDTNHKPEIICALSPITMMAGFKDIFSISKAFEEFISALPQFKEILSPVKYALDTGTLADFFYSLYSLKKTEREYLGKFIIEYDNAKECKIIQPKHWELMKYFASLYPEDPAVISPLFLNFVTILPGQAVYIPAGVLHTYISGFGVELMTASDNVLRGGLTPKYTDIGELMKILCFVPFLPQLITPAPDAPVYEYFTPCWEYSLVVMKADGGKNTFTADNPAICLVTEGEVSAGGIIFKKGESFFVPPCENVRPPLVLSGNYTLYAAVAGEAPDENPG
jgi:mannose-6-phosphate isomerase